MKPLSLQQEIFLVKTSKISRRQLAGDHSLELNRLSFTEQLEEACWNGMLEKLLPEMIEKPPSGKKLHLWQIRSGAEFLHIEFCTFPIVIDKRYSLDPYLFIPTTCAN